MAAKLASIGDVDVLVLVSSLPDVMDIPLLVAKEITVVVGWKVRSSHIAKHAFESHSFTAGRGELVGQACRGTGGRQPDGPAGLSRGRRRGVALQLDAIPGRPALSLGHGVACCEPRGGYWWSLRSHAHCSLFLPISVGFAAPCHRRCGSQKKSRRGNGACKVSTSSRRPA